MPSLRRATATALLALGLFCAALPAAGKGAAKTKATSSKATKVKQQEKPKAARHHASARATPAQVQKPSDQGLGAKITAAQGSLSRLEKDARRRRYRDGWESISSTLEAAVRASPASPRAAEAGMLAARAREGLWNASRRSQDAIATVAAYREIERRHEGRESGQQALVAAIRFAKKAGATKDLVACGKRLATYPRGSEMREALSLAGVSEAPVKAVVVAVVKPAPGLAGALQRVRPATAADRAAHKPVDDGDGEDDEDAGPAPAVVKPTAPLSGARAARAGRDAPPSPVREPDSDVPAEAARVLDALVQAVRERGAADLLGESKPPVVKAPERAGPAPLAKEAEPVAPSGSQLAETARAAAAPAVGLLASARAALSANTPGPGRDDAETPPEPEEETEGAEDVVPHRTKASAPRTLSGAQGDPDQEQRARAIRAAVLSQGATPLAAQLGLKVRTIAVDAGHGGRDTGAIGGKGLREKDATLAIARKVAARLNSLGFKVVMTRETDAYVALSERTRIANDAGADLFVSIHCNAARRKGLSGVETWTLDVAADRYAQRLSAFENAEADATVGNLRLILADLATRSNTGEARELARSVQSSLVRTLRGKSYKLKDHGVKHALFYVLLGAHMPAILVETAFLSNPEEEKRLRSPKYQDSTAEAVSRGLKEYLESRRRLALAP